MLAPGPADLILSIEGERDIVNARQQAREVAKRLGFSMVDQSRIATAVSELTRNVVRYATGGRGQLLIRALPRSERGVGIEIVVDDDGPGIPDIAEAMRAGVTAGAGLGMGLPGTKRLMDDMEIDSGPGRGTVVAIRKWHR